MPSHARNEDSAGDVPWGGTTSNTSAPRGAADTLGRLAATMPASRPEDLLPAWIARAGECLPVHSLHVTVREGVTTRIWSYPSDATFTDDRRQVEAAMDAGETRVTPLADAGAPATVCIVTPMAVGERTIGALVADAAPEAAAGALDMLEALRWPLGLRLVGLIEPPGAGAAPLDGALYGLCQGKHRCETLNDLLSLHQRALEGANRELEQHRAQAIDSKGALEAILEGFPDGLFIVDRDLRVTLSNDVQALRVQGAGPATGQFCWEMFGSGGGVCPGCRVMDTLKKGVSTRRRMRVRLPGQPEREWEVTTHPIAPRSARSTRAALVIVRDVTEQEQMAKSLAQVEKLAAVGRLAAGIAHEINNPLAAIQANVQLLSGSGLDAEQAESLEIMQRATERARCVVRNLLSFSEQSLGYLAPVDVNATIRTALDLISHQAQRGGVTLECRLAEELPQVMASQDQLESVWLNLALNALDAVLEGGVAGRIEVTSEVAPQGRIRVTFCDNGPGIPAHRLPHVFEPFGSHTSPTVGTGLGLYSCQSIVIRHGGTIHARAGEGGGSCFEVLLPAVAQDGEGPSIGCSTAPNTETGAA